MGVDLEGRRRGLCPQRSDASESKQRGSGEQRGASDRSVSVSVGHAQLLAGLDAGQVMTMTGAAPKARQA
jgi:hypothetical protein